MTIREYLKQRANQFRLWIYLSLIPGVLVAWLGSRDNFLLLFGCIVLFFAVILITSFTMSRTPCPRCGTPLGNVATRANMAYARREQHCPSCGVSVDEPI